MDFDHLIDRCCTESLRWNIYPKDVLPLWVADMDFESPECVIEALHERIDHRVFGYGLPPVGLKEVFVERMRKLYDWEVACSQLTFVPGVVTGFNLALRALCQPGDAVIFFTPAYPPFFSGPKSSGLTVVECPMLEGANGSYNIDFELFEQLIVNKHVKAYIHCDPQNPTGRAFTRGELEKLAEILLRHHVYTCSDEIHCDLVYDGRKHIPFASLSTEVSDTTLTFMAPSKTFNVAGLYASVGIIQNESLFEQFNTARGGLVGSPDLLSLTAAKAAYEGGADWLQACLTYLQANRDWLIENINSRLTGVKVARPEATFLMWLDCRETGLESPYKFFLEKAHVGLNDGMVFGQEYDQFVRLNFGTPRANLEKAISAMEKSLKDR
ncbi:MAG TPA: MalY/PatB family protein [Anaerolineaceae bacterium]|nr:MalY/PatB family protein [Anaerolineaceae bacterium]